MYASVLTDANDDVLQKFIDMHNSSDLQEEKMRIATSLGSVRKEELIRKVLNFAVSVIKIFQLKYIVFTEKTLSLCNNQYIV